MKDPWKISSDLSNTDRILTSLRQMNVQEPSYSHIKQAVEEEYGPSEYNEDSRRGLKGSRETVQEARRICSMNIRTCKMCGKQVDFDEPYCDHETMEESGLLDIRDRSHRWGRASSRKRPDEG